MNKTITFFGHREIFNYDEIKKRLMEILKEKIKKGYREFLIGIHGEFDSMALSGCLYYKTNLDKGIRISIVLTSLAVLKKGRVGYNNIEYYKSVGCDTMIYDIEEVHFKNKIIVSNRKMIDDSDLIVCYVDMDKYRSGAKKAVNYAIKQGKDIINLYREEDKSIYAMTKEEIDVE